MLDINNKKKLIESSKNDESKSPYAIPWKKDESAASLTKDKNMWQGPIPWKKDESAASLTKDEYIWPVAIPWKKEESAASLTKDENMWLGSIPWKKDESADSIKNDVHMGPLAIPWKKDENKNPYAVPWKRQESEIEELRNLNPAIPWKRDELNSKDLKSEESLKSDESVSLAEFLWKKLNSLGLLKNTENEHKNLPLIKKESKSEVFKSVGNSDDNLSPAEHLWKRLGSLGLQEKEVKKELIVKPTLSQNRIIFNSKGYQRIFNSERNNDSPAVSQIGPSLTDNVKRNTENNNSDMNYEIAIYDLYRKISEYLSTENSSTAGSSSNKTTIQS